MTSFQEKDHRSYSPSFPVVDQGPQTFSAKKNMVHINTGTKFLNFFPFSSCVKDCIRVDSFMMASILVGQLLRTKHKFTKSKSCCKFFLISNPPAPLTPSPIQSQKYSSSKFQFFLPFSSLMCASVLNIPCNVLFQLFLT